MKVSSKIVSQGPEAIYNLAEKLKAYGVTKGNTYILTDDNRLLKVECITGLGYIDESNGNNVVCFDTVIVGSEEAEAVDLIEAIAEHMPSSEVVLQNRFTTYIAHQLQNTAKEVIDLLKALVGDGQKRTVV